MDIMKAIDFLENELDIDSDKCTYKKYSEQTEKVYEIVKFLKDLNTTLNCRAYDQEHGVGV